MVTFREFLLAELNDEADAPAETETHAEELDEEQLTPSAIQKALSETNIKD